ncbi:hypothetical protein SEA_RASOVI_44 [Microbacterium phage Rasovi]|nr:hypothetical protein SEA_RASOVI_44 [Microbacterium phage Rasovi]
MARIHHVKKSAKEHTCSGHGHTIAKGEPYTWAKPGFRTRRPVRRCLKHPFRESDLITGQRAEIVRAKEDALEAIDNAESPEDVESAVAEFASAAEDYQSTRQEALDAWPNGNSQLEEFVYQAEAIASEVDSWTADEFDEPDQDEFEEDPDAADYEGLDEWVEFKRAEHLDEVKDAARDLIEGLDM